MDFEEVAYTIMVFAVMIMVYAGVIPITLIGRNLANPANTIRLHLFLQIESVGVLVLGSTYALSRVTRRSLRRSSRDDY